MRRVGGLFSGFLPLGKEPIPEISYGLVPDSRRIIGQRIHPLVSYVLGEFEGNAH